MSPQPFVLLYHLMKSAENSINVTLGTLLVHWGFPLHAQHTGTGYAEGTPSLEPRSAMYTLPCTLPPRGARHRHLWPALAFGLLMPMGAMADAALSGPGLVPVSQISAADTAWVRVSTALVLRSEELV